MTKYIIRRFFYMIILLVILSMVSFIIIQLPPGDWVDTFVWQMQQRLGIEIDEAMMRQLNARYGFDLPLYQQYLKWIGNIILRGDFGQSMMYTESVSVLIKERIGMSVVLSLSSLLVTYIIAIPIGIYSALRPYTIGDYIFTTLGFIGLATPNILLALVLMWILQGFGLSQGGLFSPEFLAAPWSFARIIDLIKHLPVPLIVIGTAGAAGLIRILRSSLIDELGKQYVVTARAKGVGERRLLFKYPVRLAINPIISHIGGILPTLISGEALVSIVLSLPTIGPMLLQGLRQQDQYLAASIILILGALAMLGTLISDLLLVVVDPRIRFEKKG